MGPPTARSTPFTDSRTRRSVFPRTAGKASHYAKDSRERWSRVVIGSSRSTRMVSTIRATRRGCSTRSAMRISPLAQGVERQVRCRSAAALRITSGERGGRRIVTIAAAGEPDPRDATGLLDALGDADLSVGARRRAPGQMPLGRRITNHLSAAAVARCVGQPVADAQSGFRAMRAAVAADVKPAGARYEFETEFLIRAAR